MNSDVLYSFLIIVIYLFVDIQIVTTKDTCPLLTDDVQLAETLPATTDDPWTIQVIYQDDQSEVAGLFTVDDETLIPLQKTLEIDADTPTPILELDPTQLELKPNLQIPEQVIEEEPKQLPKSDDKYVCPKCDRVYNARRNLSRHLNLECGKEPQYKCDFCSYRNHRRNEIKKHLLKKHQIYYTDGC